MNLSTSCERGTYYLAKSSDHYIANGIYPNPPTRTDVVMFGIKFNVTWHVVAAVQYDAFNGFRENGTAIVPVSLIDNLTQ